MIMGISKHSKAHMVVGLILMLIAMKEFADYYKEGGIFNNALYRIIAAVVGVIPLVVIAVTAAVDLSREIGISMAKNGKVHKR
jgi:uncharacterized membrane protein